MVEKKKRMNNNPKGSPQNLWQNRPELKNNPELYEKTKQEICGKGGVNSGISKRERRSFEDTLKALLKITTTHKQASKLLGKDNQQLLKLLKESGDEEYERLTLNDLASLSLLKNALNGDTKAFEIVRDTVGEKPVEKTENSLLTEGFKVTIEDA